MKKYFLGILLFCSVAGLAIVSLDKHIGFANESTEPATPQTIKLMEENAKEDRESIDFLNNFSDSDYIIAYPKEYGGGYSIKSSDSNEPLVGEILDEEGESVIYRDDNPVTVAEVKEAISNMN